MIIHAVRLALLVLNAHAVWPTEPIDRVSAAASAAVDAETADVPAELLLGISEHESDLRPNTVSYVVGGRRLDNLWTNLWAPPDRLATCGYGQTVARGRAECAAAIVAGMRPMVAELEEELASCRGDMRCALSCYAGGNAGVAAWRARRRTTATTFAALFYRRAKQLGARFSAPWS